MQLTPMARVFIGLVSIAVIAYVLFRPDGEAPAPPSGENQLMPASQRHSEAAALLDDLVKQVGGATVPGMVHIDGGSFAYGADAQPATVEGFYIDRTEVTNAAYAAYLKASAGAGSPAWFQDAGWLAAHALHPVVGVSWQEARDYCARVKRRLPTGKEWERAARGTDGRELPWGNELDRGRARVMSGDAKAVAAAKYGLLTVGVDDAAYRGDVSPDGVLGMAGNAAEWTEDAGSSGERMVRGGSWASYQLTDAATWKVAPTRADLRATRVGFRCAVSEDGAAALGDPALASSGLDQIKASGVLRVGAEPDTPPMLISGSNGSWSGFDYELAQALATRLGVSVQIVPGRYADLPSALAQGQIDVIVSGYTPDAQLKAVSWSKPYLEFGLCLVARSDSGIRRVADLKGKRVGVFNDPVAERVARGLAPEATISTWEDGYFQVLADKGLDAFVYDFPYAQAELKPFGDTLRIVEYNLSDQVYAVGVKAGQAALLEQVNQAIAGLRGTDGYKKMVRRWMGSAKAVEDFEAGETVYVVKAGDSLSAIAAKKLGDVQAWPRIWAANRHRIGNPDLIDIGMKIAIPKE